MDNSVGASTLCLGILCITHTFGGGGARGPVEGAAVADTVRRVAVGRAAGSVSLCNIACMMIRSDRCRWLAAVCVATASY